MSDIAKMQEDAQTRNLEVLNMIGALSDATYSDGASSVRSLYCFCVARE
jgi:uncharacterized alpha/beta hydrolase family protein